jgi:hypothetical protein
VIALPPSWRRTSSVGADVFASPDRAIQIRYRSRIAPLRRAAAVIDEALAALPEWHTEQTAPRERFVTREGEHAFGAPATGTWLGQPARRYIAAIYGDDFYDVLDAIALGDRPIVAPARELAQTAMLRLGIRRRRYFYEPPPGWHGHATGLAASWFPPLFPARPTTIVVYPANPTNERPHTIYDAMVAQHAAEGSEVRELEHPMPFVARSGLEGMHWRFALVAPGAVPIARDLVVFARKPYTYALQLDSLHQLDFDLCSVFLALAASVEPVGVGAATSSDSSVFSHYV